MKIPTEVLMTLNTFYLLKAWVEEKFLEYLVEKEIFWERILISMTHRVAIFFSMWNIFTHGVWKMMNQLWSVFFGAFIYDFFHKDRKYLDATIEVKYLTS